MKLIDDGDYASASSSLEGMDFANSPALLCGRTVPRSPSSCTRVRRSGFAIDEHGLGVAAADEPGMLEMSHGSPMAEQRSVRAP